MFGVDDGEIELLLFVWEKSEIGDFFCEEGCFFLGVRWLDADEDEKAFLNFGDDLAADGYGGGVYPLYENFHKEKIKLR